MKGNRHWHIDGSAGGSTFHAIATSRPHVFFDAGSFPAAGLGHSGFIDHLSDPVPPDPPAAVSPSTGSGAVWGALVTLGANAARHVGAFANTLSLIVPARFAVPAPSPARTILLFGPNGSGKGTQGALVAERLPGLAHLESGALFRAHVANGTALGRLAKGYIDRGELVPDAVTVPMMLTAMRTHTHGGWLLDGFPRNPTQARALWEALQAEGLSLDLVAEIQLPRTDAKRRIMGRRLCRDHPSHSNNEGIPGLAPAGGACRVCGGELTIRQDDQDEAAIDTRHDIYYNGQAGTLAAVAFFRRLAAAGAVRYAALDGARPIAEVAAALTGVLWAK